MKRIVIVLLASTSILSAQGLSSLLGGSNAKKIQGVAVKASLGCTNGQILKYVSANSQFECADDSGGSGAGDVEGATNLTTAGRMVGVSAANTVTEYSDFIRTAAGRYQIYDATATTGATTLTVRAGEGQSSTNLQQWLNSAGTTQAFITGGGYANFAGAFIGGGTGKIDLGYYSARVQLASDYALTFSSTTAVNGSSDLGLIRSSANNLAITNGSSTTYWTLGAGGITCGSGDGNSAACDVGTTGARIRNLVSAGSGTFAGSVSASGNLFTGSSFAVLFGSRSQLSSPADGNVLLQNAAASSFGLLQFGGTSNLFPAWKRNSTALSARLADDSADAPVSASLFRTCQTEADGCWQFTVSGSDMILQYRTGGSWVTKATWAP